MLYANQSLGGVDQQPVKPLKQISYKKKKQKKNGQSLFVPVGYDMQ